MLNKDLTESFKLITGLIAAQWLSGYMCDTGFASSRLIGGIFASLCKTLYPLLNTGSTQDDRKMS